MYSLPENPTALDIISRSMTCHPTLFVEALTAREKEDRAYSRSRRFSLRTNQSIVASADAAKRAADRVHDGALDAFRSDMSAGIIALNVACQLQCLPRHVRTTAAVTTWGN